METGLPAIVLDCGSFTTKAGLAGEVESRVELRTVVWHSKPRPFFISSYSTDSYVGEVQERSSRYLNASYPVERGNVTNWDDLEKMWSHTFYNELRMAPDEQGLLVTESPVTITAHRERTVQMAFETFGVPRFYLCNQAELAVLSRGLATALVVDSGEGRTVSVPVSDGYALPYATMQTHIGGKDVTDVLVHLFSARGIHLTSKAMREIVQDIKAKLGYVAMNAQHERTTAKQIPYDLPDGSILPIGEERYLCTEILFDLGSELVHEKLPHCVFENLPNSSVSTIAAKSLQYCEIDSRSQFYRTIITAGGSSLFPNFSDRLIRDIRSLLSIETEVNSISAGKYGVWIGGSILAALESFSSAWITKEGYDERGPAVVHRKIA